MEVREALEAVVKPKEGVVDLLEVRVTVHPDVEQDLVQDEHEKQDLEDGLLMLKALLEENRPDDKFEDALFHSSEK